MNYIQIKDPYGLDSSGFLSCAGPQVAVLVVPRIGRMGEFFGYAFWMESGPDEQAMDRDSLLLGWSNRDGEICCFANTLARSTT